MNSLLVIFRTIKIGSLDIAIQVGVFIGLAFMVYEPYHHAVQIRFCFVIFYFILVFYMLVEG